jgi:hypothetical protein
MSRSIGCAVRSLRAALSAVLVLGAAAMAGAADSFVYVCTDAGAGAYEAFPDVCRLKDGRLMCVFYAGYGHVAFPNDKLPMGGRISYCISSDEGKTWSAAETLYDGPHDDRDPSIAQLSDGRLVCNFFTLKKSSDGKKPWEGTGSWYITSDDAGKTWTRPAQLAAGDYYTSAPIREMSKGLLMVGLYRATDGGANGAVTRMNLRDGEKAIWEKPIDIDGGEYRLDAETDVIELKDGSIFAALRGDGATPMCWSVSKDRGAHWSVARSIGFQGHCPCLHRTNDGILLLAHRAPNTNLNYSLDEARTWSENVLVDSVFGAYPSMVNLKDGSVLIVYYEEGEGSNIRAKKFRATKGGIEWLVFESRAK